MTSPYLGGKPSARERNVQSALEAGASGPSLLDNVRTPRCSQAVLRECEPILTPCDQEVGFILS
jgi:hypothetical protein